MKKIWSRTILNLKKPELDISTKLMIYLKCWNTSEIWRRSRRNA